MPLSLSIIGFYEGRAYKVADSKSLSGDIIEAYCLPLVIQLLEIVQVLNR